MNMEENTKKRRVKTPEEKIADIDKKIEHYKEMIVTLQQKKKDIIKPPKRKPRVTKKMVQDSLKTLVEGGVLTEEEAQQNLEKFAAK